MALRYSILRFVPDPARGEFINVGAIVTDGESNWLLKINSNLRRARAISTRPEEMSALEDYLERFKEEFQRKEITFEYLNDQNRRRNNLLQITEAWPVAGDEVEEAMDIVFDRLIV